MNKATLTLHIKRGMQQMLEVVASYVRGGLPPMSKVVEPRWLSPMPDLLPVELGSLF